MHGCCKQAVKVVRSHLTSCRKPAAIVEARADTALHRLDDFFVFHLDFVQIGADSLLTQ
jgi:hypothetical protein